jgi:hypothetical protein
MFFIVEKNPLIVPINSVVSKEVPTISKSSDLKRDHSDSLQDSPVKQKKAKTSKKESGSLFF